MTSRVSGLERVTQDSIGNLRTFVATAMLVRVIPSPSSLPLIPPYPGYPLPTLDIPSLPWISPPYPGSILLTPDTPLLTSDIPTQPRILPS